MPPKRKRPTIKGLKTSQSSDDRPRKLLTVGSSSSGKTCLLIRYFMDRYPTGYIPHVMDNTRVNIPVFSRVVTLDLWDTPVLSLSYSDKLRPLIYVGTSVFLMCFGIDNPNSLSSLEEVWVPEVKRYTRDTRPPILLVGCKMDVRTDSVELEKMRRNGGMEPVSVQQGREVAKSIGAAMYLECSAKSRQGVDEVFYHAARLSLPAESIS